MHNRLQFSQIYDNGCVFLCQGEGALTFFHVRYVMLLARREKESKEKTMKDRFKLLIMTQDT
ncbi:MAG: hypothetical protein A3J24_05560 [Deltaproteobacteria bacterium RIFCSPLOWO2_02_FULL_53_8]|nr:MAG: hypothetical protein A3J24_05560 [Deltaproteobacteria bacterium RIFCSPLOWO2_02_FULL_53_8]